MVGGIPIVVVASLLGAGRSAGSPARGPVVDPACGVYAGNGQGAQGELVVLKKTDDGKPRASFDGAQAVVQLVNDRARVCRIVGELDLLDVLVQAYEFKRANGAGGCMLLLNMSAKRVVLRDTAGTCGPELCGEGWKLDGLALARSPKAKEGACATLRAGADVPPR